MSGRGMYGTEKRSRSPISRRKIAGAVAVLIVASGFLFVYNYGLPATSFHFELEYPQHVSRTSVFLSLTSLDDCLVNISFVDDPDLVYRMDIKLSEPAFASDAFVHTVSHNWERGGGQMMISFAGSIIRATMTKILVDEVQLVLGSATPYDLVVRGSNVTSTITFGNNMIGSDSSLNYQATGPSLTLIFTEDMVFFNSGMEVSMLYDLPDYVNLLVDLPHGVNGSLLTTSILDREFVSGWTYRSVSFPPDVTKYSTDPSDPEPLLSLYINAVYRVRAWLMD